MIATVSVEHFNSTSPSRSTASAPTPTAFASVYRDSKQAATGSTQTAVASHADSQGAERSADAPPVTGDAAPQPAPRSTTAERSKRSGKRQTSQSGQIVPMALVAAQSPMVVSGVPGTHPTSDAAPTTRRDTSADGVGNGANASKITVPLNQVPAETRAVTATAATVEAALSPTAQPASAAGNATPPPRTSAAVSTASDKHAPPCTAPLPQSAPNAHPPAAISEHGSIASRRAPSSTPQATAHPAPATTDDRGATRAGAASSVKASGAAVPIPAAQPAQPGLTTSAAIAQVTTVGVVSPNASPVPTSSAPAAPIAPTASLPAAVGSSAWSSQIGQQVVQMVQQGPHDVLLQLHPANLGSLAVHVHLDGQSVQVAFVTQQPQVAQAVQQSLPTLQDALAGAGAQLAGTWVGQQSPRRGWGGRPGRGGSERIPSVRQSTATAASARGDTWGPSTTGTVDFYV